jgi:hypothetical protein
MKNILKALLLSLSLVTFAYADGEPKETTKVCVDVIKDGKPVMDKKTGKPQQQCKTMKVHKKLEGTKVPEKK